MKYLEPMRATMTRADMLAALRELRPSQPYTEADLKRTAKTLTWAAIDIAEKKRREKKSA